MSFTSTDFFGEAIVTDEPRLGFGYWVAIPQETEAAWGARAIFTRSAMELLRDRQGHCYRSTSARDRLVDHLNNRGALRLMQKQYAHLCREGQIREDEENEVVLFEDEHVKAVGNTNASCGYFYVAAWLKPEEKCE